MYSSVDEPIPLVDFSMNYELPQTVRIEEGYDSPVSEESSLSQGEILILHQLKDETKVLGTDARGNRFCIPWYYPNKIFESISNKCNPQCNNVKELMDSLPKYVRALCNIPQSGIKYGTELELREPCRDRGGNSVLLCKVLGTDRLVSLTSNDCGPFQTFESVQPELICEIVHRDRVPTRVRVRGYQAKAYCGVNKERVEVSGVLTIEAVVHEKVLLASTMAEDVLRVMKIPMDLEVVVTAVEPVIEEGLYSRICAFVDKNVDPNSTITAGVERGASWVFSVQNDISRQIETTYERPKPFPKTKPKSKPKPEPRYVKIESKTTEREVGERGPPGTRRKPVVPPQTRNKEPLTLTPTSPPPKESTEKANETISNSVMSRARMLEGKLHGKVMEKATGNHTVKVIPAKTEYKDELYEAIDEPNPSRVSTRKQAATGNGKETSHRRNIKQPVIPKRSSENPEISVRNANTVVEPQDGAARFAGSEEPKQQGQVFVTKNIPPSIRASELDNEGGLYETLDSINIKASISHQKDIPPRPPKSQRDANAESPERPEKQTIKPPERNVVEHTKRLKGYSVAEVGEWLDTLGMSQYKDNFAENLVDGDLLSELDDDMLQSLGVKIPLHRKKFQMFIYEGWVPNLSSRTHSQKPVS